VDQQVLQRLTADGDAEIIHPHPVSLHDLARGAHLLQSERCGNVQSAPLTHPTLERTQLALLVPPRMLVTQPAKQRLRLKLRRFGEHLYYSRPYIGERIRMSPIRPRLPKRTRQTSLLLVLSYCLPASQIRLCRRLLLRAALLSLAHCYPYLGVRSRQWQLLFGLDTKSVPQSAAGALVNGRF